MADIANKAAAPEKQNLYWHFNRFLERHLPERLYPRSLIIIIAPIVLLQAIMAFVFMEREPFCSQKICVSHRVQMPAGISDDMTTQRAPRSHVRIESCWNLVQPVGHALPIGTLQSSDQMWAA